jgi:hypothetical protein
VLFKKEAFSTAKKELLRFSLLAPTIGRTNLRKGKDGEHIDGQREAVLGKQA